MGDFEVLFTSLVQEILGRLDVAALCSCAASCRLLRKYAKEALEQLKIVHISRGIFLKSQQLKAILLYTSSLRSLKVDCFHIRYGSELLNHVIKPTLEELVLYNCYLSSEVLVTIGRMCPSLKSLQLELGWRDESAQTSLPEARYSRGLQSVLEGCKQLESLSLRFDVLLRGFDTDAFSSIPRLTEGTLKNLELGFLAERDAKSVLEVFRHETTLHLTGPWGGYPVLERLCLGLDRITDTLLATISANLPSLVELDLQDEPTEEPLMGFDLTNVGIVALCGIASLRHLSLVRQAHYFTASFKRVNDLGLLLLSTSCTNLETVKLGGFSKITDAGCAAFLHNCPNLKTFELRNMSQVTDLAFHDLSATPKNLECVTLSPCVLLTDVPVVRFAECKHLRSLNLSGCRSVGDEGVKALSRLPELKTLNLNGTDVSDYGLWWLGKGVSQLRELSLRYCHRLTSKGIHALFIGAICHTLESLDLSGISSLTDDATKQLVCSGVQLTELWLRDCPLLTSNTVAVLAESNAAQNLRVLDFWNSRGVKLISNWLCKPYFPHLRWLGLSKSVQLTHLVMESRPCLTVRRDGCIIPITYWYGGSVVAELEVGGDEIRTNDWHEVDLAVWDEVDRWVLQ